MSRANRDWVKSAEAPIKAHIIIPLYASGGEGA
jgi:hypothetical protein